MLTRLYQGKCALGKDERSSSGGKFSRRKIMVGTNHQVQLPDSLQKYDDALPYDNEDILMWDPKCISPKEIEEYLVNAAEPGGEGEIPMGNHTRDDEAALHILLQCDYNTEEALRRLKLNNPPDQTQELPWSQEESNNFEEGFKTYGKKFRLIHINKVRTRTIGEIVRFYYLWKKTERYDAYAYKSRQDKKRYYLRPGITDYMEKFFDGDEQKPLQSVVYGDPDWKPDEKPAVPEKKRKTTDDDE